MKDRDESVEMVNMKPCVLNTGDVCVLILTGRIMTACFISTVFCIKDKFIPWCLVSKQDLRAMLALRFETVATSSPGPDEEQGIKPLDGQQRRA